MKKKKVLLLKIALLGFAGLAIFVTRPIIHLLSYSYQDRNEPIEIPSGHTNDASRLNLTKIDQVWAIPADNSEPITQLSNLLKIAKQRGLRISIAGAQHSMGGHTIYPGGILINMLPFKEMELDKELNILRVQSGAIWKDVIAYLDSHGRSVKVMQSNNSFSVGGSISVNCHGWQYNCAPIASTVESFRLMLADGTVRNCSRTHNRELFSLALGGYGLFGIILDVDLHVTNNQRYQLKRIVVPAVEALAAFDALVDGAQKVEMIYARMNTSPRNFLNDVIIYSFSQDPNQSIPKLVEPDTSSLRRAVFRASTKSEYGKEFRWNAEAKLQAWISKDFFSRNSLLNESVETFENRTSDSTDILHEYFIPRKNIEDFVGSLKRIIPKHELDLLNVTVRSVQEDHDTFLRFADQPMIAFVLLFVQDLNNTGDHQMQKLSSALIDEALKCGGRYYLPYRLHASIEQFKMAYPQATEFFKKKLTYDRDELFQNEFYLKYKTK